MRLEEFNFQCLKVFLMTLRIFISCAWVFLYRWNMYLQSTWMQIRRIFEYDYFLYVVILHCWRLVFYSRCSCTSSICNVQKRAKTCKNVQKRAITCKNVQNRAKTCKNVQKRAPQVLIYQKTCTSRSHLPKNVQNRAKTCISNVFGPFSKTCIVKVRASWGRVSRGLTVPTLLLGPLAY